MLLYHESGVAYTTNWTWTDNGRYPIISFGRFVFKDRFTITRDGVELVEDVDYIRVLKSKDTHMKFGVHVFGGVVILSTDSQSLDIFGVDSVELDETLPTSTDSPYTVNPWATTNPLTGSYQDMVDAVDELENLIPYIKGITLPKYVFMHLGVCHPTLGQNVEVKFDYIPIEVVHSCDIAAVDSVISARSDFLQGGIDSLPLDYLVNEYNTVPTPYTHGVPRLGLVPLSTIPLGISYNND